MRDIKLTQTNAKGKNMSEFNFESFNFENLAGDNPFGEQKTGYSDDRFYKLPKDKDGSGNAIIRFLPDPDKKLIQQLFQINVNNIKDGQKRWYTEWSPQNVGRKDPFQDHWAALWNSGDKEESRKFARKTRYLTNILVVKDPQAPENEGKVFLFDMSMTLKEKLAGYLMPTKNDLALGKKTAELFNPINGQNFLLVSRKGANGFINYDSSEPMSEKTPAFESKEAAIDAIMNRCYRLDEFLNADMYPNDEFLREKLEYVLFKDVKPTSKAAKGDKENEVVDIGNDNLEPIRGYSPDENLDKFLADVM